MTRAHAVLISLALSACGYSEQEMQLARDRQHRLEAALDDTLGKLEQCEERRDHPDEEAADAGHE